jgi:hypothetical protein
VGKRSRKQRTRGEREAQAPAAPPAKRRGPQPRPWPERPSVTRERNAAARESRSEAKNAAVREQLEPLEEGERPLAVTIGAVVTLVLGVANIVLFAFGVKVGGQKPTVSGIAGPTLIMFVAAYGMWRKRYWAVLGVEALLGLIIVFFSLLALRAENVVSVLVALAVIVPSGVLFWFLIRAMARIQMPERPRTRQGM